MVSSSSSSSSSSIKSWNYDVFLSFSGPDTRDGFTGHLYKALRDKGVNVFIDNELLRGEVITSQLLRVIEASRISIVVLSGNYSSSSFCLDEAVKILECKESKEQIVLPVFYHVDPTDVEEQRGTFGKEFSKLEAQFNTSNLSALPLKKRWSNSEEATTNMDRVRKWRSALTELARLSGWHLKEGNHEATTVQIIVEKVLQKLDPTRLLVAEYPIGLDNRVEHILKKLNLESNDVRMLGLYGMGGIGKTTTAKAIYNRCASQFGFDGSCFLLNVRENSKKYDLSKLQETLLFEILGDQKHLMGNFEKGIQLIKGRLGGKKVVIVIDDVDHIEQLQKLAGGLEWFGAGSRIIITTRDSHLLKLHGVTMVHEIKELADAEAMDLFSWHAFKELRPGEAFVELSRLVIKYAQGLPLALEVLGSSLYGRDVPMWEEVLKKLKQCPNNEITGILKVSYDGLDSEEKAIFLDIACFLKGKYKDDVIKFLDAFGFHANFGLERLIEKSLVYVDRGQRVEMHDLLQEMGTQIGLRESSRLCIRKPEDIRFFLEKMRPNDVEGILLDFHGEEELPLDLMETFTNLRILIIHNGCFTGMPKTLPDSIRWLEWPDCSLESIPAKFLPKNLVALKMPHSRIVHFENALIKYKAKKFTNLTLLDLRHCVYLREIGGFPAMPNLEDLRLTGCKELKKIDDSIRNLEKLKFISLRNSVGFVNLPNLPTSLEDLTLSGSGIKEISSYIGNPTNLLRLKASNCKNLVSISESISKLPHLDFLDIEDCESLVEIPELPYTVRRLKARNCKSLERFSHFHHTFEGDFANCHKLAENEMQRWRRVSFENLSLESIKGYAWGSHNLILPGNKIPQWFDHAIDIEGNASSFHFKVPPPVINENFTGIVCCAVFQTKPQDYLYGYLMKLLVNGHQVMVRYPNPLEPVHMWLCYFPNFSKAEELLWKFYWCSLRHNVVYKRIGVHFMKKNQSNTP